MAGKGAGMIDRELCDLTKQLMFTCLSGQNSGKIQEISGILEENSVVIGSRAHEYYTTVEQIKSELDSGKWEDGREYVYRPVKDWYQCTRLAENIYLVCGNLRIEKIFQSIDFASNEQIYVVDKNGKCFYSNDEEVIGSDLAQKLQEIQND